MDVTKDGYNNDEEKVRKTDTKSFYLLITYVQFFIYSTYQFLKQYFMMHHITNPVIVSPYSI